jgi:uncharacterized protein with HEPN domain
MSKSDKLRVSIYLSHILEAIERINLYTAGMHEEDFSQDEKTQDAVIRNFEIIGEASRNIERYHPEFAAKHSHVPWGIAYEMRNVLAHGYFMVDIGIVWKTIHNDLPGLAFKIKRLLNEPPPGNSSGD